MSKMTETLKAAGWVKTTLGECRAGEEVLLTPEGPCPRATRVIQPAERVGEKEPFVNTSDGGIRRGTLPVLRSPRPEYAPGTVALIRRREDQTPVRARKIRGHWIPSGDSPVDDDSVEVVRVLLPADQDIPALLEEIERLHEEVRGQRAVAEMLAHVTEASHRREDRVTDILNKISLDKNPMVTDEMVEHAAEALYDLRYGYGWDEDATEDEKDEFRELAREILEDALRGGES